jgi:hypothetical protein
MAIKTKNKKQKTVNKGIALLVAVIFMSVMLALGVALSSLGYKQAVLASSAIESQSAFYAADAALECALYADQQQQAFIYTTHDATNEPNPTVCDGTAATPLPGGYTYNATRLVFIERMSLDNGSRCADVTVYKYAAPQGPRGVTTYLFAQGYNVSCATVGSPNASRIASRGLDARY